MKNTAAILLLLFSGIGWGAPVTWTLNNVAFTDGGAATGSFTYDADTGVFSDVAITTTGLRSSGFFVDELLYENVVWTTGNTHPTATGRLQFIIPPGPVYGEYAYVNLHLLSTMTNISSPTTIALLTVPGYSEEVIDSGTSIYPFFFGRDVVSGSISAVPVPATVWLLASALGALGWRTRKV